MCYVLDSVFDLGDEKIKSESVIPPSLSTSSHVPEQSWTREWEQGRLFTASPSFTSYGLWSETLTASEMLPGKAQWYFTFSPPILLSLQLTPHPPGSAFVQSPLDSLFSSWQNPGIFLEPSRLGNLYCPRRSCRDNLPPPASQGLTPSCCLACRLCWRALFLSAGRGNGQ